MSITYAHLIVGVLWALSAVIGVSTGRATYKGEFGRLFPAVIMGIASASGTFQIIAWLLGVKGD